MGYVILLAWSLGILLVMYFISMCLDWLMFRFSNQYMWKVARPLHDMFYFPTFVAKTCFRSWSSILLKKMSGYSGRVDLEHASLEEKKQAIQKKFRMETPIEVISNVLLGLSLPTLLAILRLIF